MITVSVNISLNHIIFLVILLHCYLVNNCQLCCILLLMTQPFSNLWKNSKYDSRISFCDVVMWKGIKIAYLKRVINWYGERFESSVLHRSLWFLLLANRLKLIEIIKQRNRGLINSKLIRTLSGTSLCFRLWSSLADLYWIRNERLIFCLTFSVSMKKNKMADQCFGNGFQTFFSFPLLDWVADIFMESMKRIN